MVPVDIDPKNLAGLMRSLLIDPEVIGGAVTMPHKAGIMEHLTGTSALAEAAGAVNCLARDPTGFVGENTDGIAALRSLEREFGPVAGSRVLLLGAGGVGSAIAAALSGALGPTGSLTIASRTKTTRDALVERLRGKSPGHVRATDGWPVSDMPPPETFDIIINATSLGFEFPIPNGGGWLPARLATPVTGAERYPVLDHESAENATASALSGELEVAIAGTLGWLENQTGALVFDVIYQPSQTLLLTLANLAGCRTLNGSWMNLEQAVIAFCIAASTPEVGDIDPDEVRAAMLAATEESA